MKKVFVLLLLIISLRVFANETVVFATGDWEPFTSSREENGKIAENIITEAFKLENIDAVFEYYPWKRSFEYAKDGRYAGTFPWLKTEEREVDFLYHNEAVIFDKTVFFYLKGMDFDWFDYGDLSNYKIGVTIGYAITEILEKEGLRIESSTSDDSNYRKLFAGRLDLYPNNIYVGYYQIKMLFSDLEVSQFTHHPKPVMREEPMYMLFSRNHPDSAELARKLDSGLRKLKASGRYDDILSELVNN